MSQHPWVNEYIKQTIDSIRKQLEQPNADISSVDVVVNGGGKAERFKLEFMSAAALVDASVTWSQADPFLVSLELVLGDLILWKLILSKFFEI